MTPPSDPRPETTVDDLVDVLSLRIDLLRELSVAGGPLEKRTLVDRLDVSRSTVDRGVQRLGALGLVRGAPEGFTTTKSGELICTEYLKLTDVFASVLAVQDLIDHLPADAPLSVEFLAVAETVQVVPDAPARPAVRISELLEGADRLRALTKAISSARSEQVLRNEVERGLEVEVVFSNGVFEYVRATHEWIPEYVADGQYTAYTVEFLPYGLFVIDRPDDGQVACLIVQDEDGQLRGALVAENDRAVEWAQQVFERYRTEGTPASFDA